jgi:hypothetical protein
MPPASNSCRWSSNKSQHLFKKKWPLAVYASMPQAIHEYMPFDEIILSQVRQQRTPFFFFLFTVNVWISLY